MDNAYAAIGRAVFYSQIFETALIPIFEFFKLHTEPGYAEKTGGLLPVGAFKVPVRNIIKALAANENIAPDLEERLSNYIEERHVLIHRWVQENGLPKEDDAEGFAPYVALANRVEQEAKVLTRMLTGYMLKYANPEWAAIHRDEYKSKIGELFLRSHIDD
jgi:hypothetical protein